jgi:predicted porin
MDRSISYTSPTINGFRLVYHTTLIAPSAPNQERTLTTLTYANGPITAQYMMGEVQDNGKQNGFGASYDLGFLKANIASAVTETAAGAKSRDMMMYSATMPLRPGLTGLVGYAKDKRQAANANTRWAVGVNYALSKRTTLGADLFEQEAAGSSQGFVLRARHTF